MNTVRRTSKKVRPFSANTAEPLWEHSRVENSLGIRARNTI